MLHRLKSRKDNNKKTELQRINYYNISSSSSGRYCYVLAILLSYLTQLFLLGLRLSANGIVLYSMQANGEA
jgi:hypothetical protein